ncbi:gene transfer agent family protein [Sagittula sp. MA-2]|jgi:hypothetical protein|uniref:gene transfer agent family protein n=1 Tax=Sagittula sp. MA-2 TaxID=3048007 RepID=UPI0024C3EBC0|nr:gene transfer agent family protein [Sagittula sp. MA-2]WHZ35758.1 gene transfer agent family protein [Sagittula sp. MA-2]
MRTVRLTWPGGEHTFRLRIGELRALQGATDSGPEELFNRIRLANWRVDDLIQIIRWGLVGGGEMDASKAATFVTPLFDLHPLSEFRMTATAILAKTLLAIEDDPLGEEEGVTETPPGNGASPSSTELQP